MPKKRAIRSLSDLTPDASNANAGTERGKEVLASSIDSVGSGRSLVVDADGNILAGNKTAEQWAALKDGAKVIVVDTEGDTLVVHRRSDLSLGDPDTEETARLLALYDNRASELGLSWVPSVMMELVAADVDLSPMFDDEEMKALLDGFNDVSDLDGSQPRADAEPETSRSDELQKEWGTEQGQIWQCGPHRVICGDCTDADVVERLMDGSKACLIHADPPYGMGKEKDGIANDNLYRDKLDAFQMEWWRTARPHVADNGSAYIWGNPEDLWRLWYVGGLRDSERLAFRNEVVWHKGNNGFGLGTEAQRCYFPQERCLFFMLGEQEFNNNADNYWEGWEPIRSYLKAQRDLMKWTASDLAKITGSTSYRHWFGRSQWEFLTREHYEKLQTAAKGGGFQRDYDDLKEEYDGFREGYDELKQEFYSTRAYFDNAHDVMTDVWQYSRVVGDGRHGHATPKPVEMIERTIKSSTPDAGTVYAPFLGTGPEIIAAHNLNRVCYGCEISTVYVAVILQRFKDHTGVEPELIGTL